MQKNKKNSKNSKNYSQEIEVGNLFKIILIILIVFGIFYIFTYYLQKNKSETNNLNNNTNHITIIQYDEILIGDSLNQSESDYYVLYVKKADYNARYKEYLSRYNNDNKFYYSLIDDGLNRNFISDTSNLNVDNIADLRISDTSLLKISNGKIVETYDGNANVMQAFIDINK